MHFGGLAALSLTVRFPSPLVWGPTASINEELWLEVTESVAECSLLCTSIPWRSKDGEEKEVRDGQRNLTSFSLLSRLLACEVEGAHLALWQLKPFWEQTRVLERTTTPLHQLHILY